MSNDNSFEPGGTAGQAGKRRPNRWHGRVEGTGRRCEHPACEEEGEFRAPPSSDAASAGGYDGPSAYRWFCLDHIREFNQSYNFFHGMSPDEIYEAQRPTAGWDRETRAFASAGGGPTPRWTDFADPIDAIGARFKENLAGRAKSNAQGSPATEADRKALRTLGLGTDADRRAIRKAYSALVRRYHPDRNGGDRSNEKALAKVIAAYTHLTKARASA